MANARLDSYNYDISHVDEELDIITIPIKDRSDVLVADIATEVNAYDNNVYAEGNYYILDSMITIFNPSTQRWELRLHVHPKLMKEIGHG